MGKRPRKDSKNLAVEKRLRREISYECSQEERRKKEVPRNKKIHRKAGKGQKTRLDLHEVKNRAKLHTVNKLSQWGELKGFHGIPYLRKLTGRKRVYQEVADPTTRETEESETMLERGGLNGRHRRSWMQKEGEN